MVPSLLQAAFPKTLSMLSPYSSITLIKTPGSERACLLKCNGYEVAVSHSKANWINKDTDRRRKRTLGEFGSLGGTELAARPGRRHPSK